jgi:hypothetical protein
MVISRELRSTSVRLDSSMHDNAMARCPFDYASFRLKMTVSDSLSVPLCDPLCPLCLD